MHEYANVKFSNIKVFCLFAKGTILRELDRDEEALKVFNSYSSSKFPLIEINTKYHIGEIFYNQNEYEKSLENFNEM